MTSSPEKVALSEVLITDELYRRPERSPDYVAEHEAFTSLTREMFVSPESLMQRLCEVALELCGAGTAGISLLESDGEERFFRWVALAGAYAGQVGDTTPRDFSPCGTCLDLGSAQLYYRPERHFTYFDGAEPPIVEGLVVPFGSPESEIGTIWMVSHDESARKFDLEDLRIMQSLGDFSAVALRQSQLHEQVRRSDARYRRLIDAIGLAVYTTDAEGRIQTFNDEAVRLWGRTPEVGRDLWCGSWKIFNPDGSPMTLDARPMAITLKERRPVRDVEILAERPDGTRIAVLPYPTPLWAEDGELLGAINVLVDITVLKKAEESARRSLAVKEQFMDLVSHELKSPLASILGSGSMLLKHGDKFTEGQKAEILRGVVSDAHRLNEDIEHLLLLAETASDQLEVQPIALGIVINAAVESFRERQPGREVTIKLPDLLPPVLGQDTLAALVLQNLLSNAHKYSPAGTNIEVIAEVNADGMVKVRVRDRGIGLDVAEIPQLFTPFYRSANAKDHASGMGVGLAVCKRVVELQGGTIGARCLDEGGAEFNFTLPAVDEPAS